jgi:DNA-binding CsgD family transcriptional regulator
MTADSGARALADVDAFLAAPASLDLDVANRLAAELDALSGQLQTALRGRAGSRLPRAAALGEQLVEVTAARDRLRRHITALRFDTLERIHAGQARLRACTTVADLVPAAAEALAECCGFDRAAVLRVRGSSWRVEAFWITPGHDAARHVERSLLADWVPLEADEVAMRLLRRRVAVLVEPDPGHHRSELTRLAESRACVAAPIVTGGRVVGILHAYCVDPGRRLTSLDRDNIASFADGFSLVFERTALLERRGEQRAQVRDVFATVERQLSGLDDADTRLIRGDRAAVSVVRTAAGLRRASVSRIDQLLTARERQVVELMVQGARNRSIGDQLVISEETVKSHVRSIAHKLRASSRADAVSAYLRLRSREPG